MNLQIKFKFIVGIFLTLFIFLSSVIFADTNGVWHNSEDIKGGVFGSDEQDLTSNFSFLNRVSFNHEVFLNNKTIINANLDVNGELKIKGKNASFLDSNGKVPLEQLPFHKGDLISPQNRILMSEFLEYDLYYFDITNLGIENKFASNVASGIKFGLNNIYTGNYTSDANAISSNLLFGKTAYVNGTKIIGSLSIDSICDSAGGTATCGATSSITPGDFYSIVGENSPVSTNYCTKFSVYSNGSVNSVNLATAGICKYVGSCTLDSQNILNYPDTTSCGNDLHCISGSCVSMNFRFTDTITGTTLNYNLKNRAINAGWNQIIPLIATVTINSGVIVGSSSASIASFDTGSVFPAGSRINIINNGYIVGKGGNGGNGGINGYGAYPGGTIGGVGENGGAALNIGTSIFVTNNGLIAGGGGGGGGAGSGGIGGFSYYTAGQGGSGGAGYYSGNAGSVGSGSGGTNGNSGSFYYGGAAVEGISAGYTVYSGGGGHLGQAGTAGTVQIVNIYPGTASYGGAGNSVTRNGNVINWITRGDVRGPEN